ncbi:hypothetical protein [Rhodococcus erythropolis]|nr:hypothetical protein [Rhodococcus erythropolis]
MTLLTSEEWKGDRRLDAQAVRGRDHPPTVEQQEALWVSGR